MKPAWVVLHQWEALSVSTAWSFSSSNSSNTWLSCTLDGLVLDNGAEEPSSLGFAVAFHASLLGS
jgi:hypothetical protein